MQLTLELCRQNRYFNAFVIPMKKFKINLNNLNIRNETLSLISLIILYK